MTVRLTKKEKSRLNDSEKLVLFYRKFPVAAAKDLLSLDLVWFQRVCLKIMWKTPFVTLVLGRGIGKSWLLAVFAVLKGMLYPGTKIGIIAPVYRQALFVFDYIEELYNNSPYLRAASLKKPVVQPLRGFMQFHNGSFIEALPVGDGNKIRGRRYHIVLGDEWAQMDPDIIKKVIRPMMNVKIKGRQNQLITSSTAYYSWNHFYTQYLFYHLMMQKLPEKYQLCEFTYEDVLMVPDAPFQIDTDILEMQRADDPLGEIYDMENKCKFITENRRFITPSMIDACTPKKFEGVNIELTGEVKSEYVMGVDVARADAGDDFAMTILKIKGDTSEVSRQISCNGESYPKMAGHIRKALVDFNIKHIEMDSRGGGLAIKDLLAEKWVDPNTKEEFPPILDADDKIYEQVNGLHILHLTNFDSSTIEAMFSNVKSKIEHKRVLFPMDIRHSSDKNFEEAAHDVIKLKQELFMLTPTVKGGHITYTVPSSYKKDRATSFALALRAWDNMNKTEVSKEQGGGLLATGFWTKIHLERKDGESLYG